MFSGIFIVLYWTTVKTTTFFDRFKKKREVIQFYGFVNVSIDG